MSPHKLANHGGTEPRHNVDAHCDTKKSLRMLTLPFVSASSETEKSDILHRVSSALPDSYVAPFPSADDDVEDRVLIAASRYKTLNSFNWPTFVLQSCGPNRLWEAHLASFWKKLKKLYEKDSVALYTLSWLLWMRPIEIPCVQAYNVVCLIRNSLGMPPLEAHKSNKKIKCASFVPYTALVTDPVERKCNDFVSLEIVVSDTDRNKLIVWETRAHRWIWIAAMHNADLVKNNIPALKWLSERITL